MFGRNGKSPEMKILDEIHFELEMVGIFLRKVIGVPLCVPDCGKCCEINCIGIKGVEAHYAARWLKKQKPEFQKQVLDRCEEWLFKDFEKVQTRWGLGTIAMPPNVIDQVNQEIKWLSQKSGCPMLTEDKKCLIYAARPIICQAYGITRVVPGAVCPRPIGKWETDEHRVFVNNKTTNKVRNLIEKLKVEIEGGPYIPYQGFLASMLYMEMQPQKFFEHAYHNDIASAKLIQLSGGHYIWQEQLQESIDREDEIRVMVNPIPIDEEQAKLEV